jgi:putative isomerase
MLTDKLFENGEGIMTDGRLRENYHPTTGEGLNANDFSWSAAHILLLKQSE